MTGQAPAPGRVRPAAVTRLLDAPRPDRRAALANLVGQEFKRALLMRAEDDLPADGNYFELGLTSLKAAEVKQRLEAELGCELESSVLFSSSTVRQIVDHLAELVLPEASHGPAAGLRQPEPGPQQPDRGPGPGPGQRALVDALLRDLYDS